MSKSYKVYLDGGHGGTDSGAVGARNVFEKNIVLEVCKKIESILKSRRIEVRKSRSTDMNKSLAGRTNDANRWRADCLVSVHCNSFKDENSKGLEIFCYKFKYRKLADFVQGELVNDRLYTVNRGVKEGNLHMVRESDMPACLVELGFISNTEDLNLIESKINELGLAIADGICNYLGVTFNSNLPIQGTVVYNILTGWWCTYEVE